MLASATSVARKGNTELFAHVALLPSHRFLAVDRAGLRYNWWYAPASTAPRTGWIGFNVVLGGHFTSVDADGRVIDNGSSERVAWLYSEDDLEGCGNGRDHGFCAHGDPLRSVAVHVPGHASPFTARNGRYAERLIVPRSIADACERYLETTKRRAPTQEWFVVARALVDAMKDAGWIHRHVEMHAPTEADARITDVIREIIGRFDPSAQLAELADRSATTPRRVDRLLRTWIARYDLPNESWRALTHRWRLKMAVMLSSSADHSIAEVAKIVGYTSTNAMTNAFATAGLPPPSWYRTADLVRLAPTRESIRSGT